VHRSCVAFPRRRFRGNDRVKGAHLSLGLSPSRDRMHMANEPRLEDSEQNYTFATTRDILEVQ